MKTSNKLLLAPLALFILFGLMGMVFLRSSLVPQGIGNGENFIEGKGSYQKKEISVDAFSKVLARNGMKFQLVKGNGKVEIEAEENLLPYFETKVESGELSIRVKEGYGLRNSENKPIKIKVGFQNLEAVTSHSGATIIMKDTVETSYFQCNIHSHSYAKVLVNAPKIRTDIQSGAELEISGRCENLEGQTQSSGILKAFDLICANTANLSAHSGGNMQLHVSGVLNVTIQSGATVVYKGNPTQVHSNTHSGGSISKAD